MANGNGNLVNRCIILLFTLLGTVIVGGIVMFRSVGIAESDIEDLDKRIDTQETVVRESLKSIDSKLTDISKTLTAQAIEAAKAHHKHPNRVQ